PATLQRGPCATSRSPSRSASAASVASPPVATTTSARPSTASSCATSPPGQYVVTTVAASCASTAASALWKAGAESGSSRPDLTSTAAPARQPSAIAGSASAGTLLATTCATSAGPSGAGPRAAPAPHVRSISLLLVKASSDSAATGTTAAITPGGT